MSFGSHAAQLNRIHRPATTISVGSPIDPSFPVADSLRVDGVELSGKLGMNNPHHALRLAEAPGNATSESMGIPSGFRSTARVVDATEQVGGYVWVTLQGDRRGDRAGRKEVTEKHDRISDVEAAIVVDVAGVEATRAAAAEQ